MQDRTTVLVDAPFLVVCGAVHMQELMNALGQEDPLGLQERLLIIYDSTTFRGSMLGHGEKQRLQRKEWVTKDMRRLLRDLDYKGRARFELRYALDGASLELYAAAKRVSNAAWLALVWLSRSVLSGEGLEGLLGAFEALAGRALAKDVEDGRVVEGEFLNVLRGVRLGMATPEGRLQQWRQWTKLKQEKEDMKKSVWWLGLLRRCMVGGHFIRLRPK